jgi:hypothetical protein
MRTGEAIIAKLLDRFMISESVSLLPFQFLQWIGSRGESDHSLVWLKLEGASIKPTTPSKFNPTWINDERFQKIIRTNWTTLRDTEETYASI